MADDFDLSSFDDETTEEPVVEEKVNPVRQLRDTLKARERENKTLQKELEDLRKFREEVEYTNRVAKMSDTFGKFGLTEKHVELYTKLNPEGDGSPEAVVAFAKEYGLPITVDDDEDQVVTSGSPFAPVDGVGTGPDSGYITRAQLEELYASNPAKAIKVLQAGRVRWNNKLD
jgi:hypothetical protein